MNKNAWLSYELRKPAAKADYKLRKAI